MSTFVQREINKRNRWVYFSNYRWLAHVAYWTWVLVAGTLMMVKEPITASVIWNNFILSNINIAIFYYVYCFFLIPYFFKRNKNLQFWILLAICFFGITSFDVYFVQHFVHLSTDSYMNPNEGFFYNYSRVILSYTFNFLMFTMLLFFMEKNEENSLVLEMEKEKKEIELVKLNLLKTNISPDFMMRSLRQLKKSAINQEHYTPESIVTFSELLRYRLYQGKQLQTPLVEEIEALNTFITFIGFDHLNNNLCVKLNINGSSEGKYVAALALINLLELFCKVIPEFPASLNMDLMIGHQVLDVVIKYDKKATGQLMSDLVTYGKDYQLLYGDEVHFQFENCDENSCIINMRLPLL
jgi:two-component system LytT family sensor kinase